MSELLIGDAARVIGETIARRKAEGMAMGDAPAGATTAEVWRHEIRRSRLLAGLPAEAATAPVEVSWW